MKKIVKFIAILIIIAVVVVLVDTIQAKVFDNSPVLKVTENNDDGSLDRIDKGIFVDTYVFTDGEKHTVFKWEDYTYTDNEDNNENEDVSFTDDELNAMALDYFLNNTENSLARDEYSVGISHDVPEIYQNKNMVVIEIRHINNGNNTLDARYYIDINTAKGFDDSDNPIDLNGD